MGCVRGTGSGKRGHISSAVALFTTTSVEKRTKEVSLCMKPADTTYVSVMAGDCTARDTQYDCAAPNWWKTFWIWCRRTSQTIIACVFIKHVDCFDLCSQIDRYELLLYVQHTERLVHVVCSVFNTWRKQNIATLVWLLVQLLGSVLILKFVRL